jgi:queuine tRNA-ribosyltransferase
MLETLAVTVPELPDGRLRYLMGIGDPVGLIEAIGLGVDQFDSVAPTRMARHGSILSSTGRLNLRNASYVRDDRPLDAACGCTTCAGWSRGYLRHLVTVGEPTAWRLLSIHNLAYVVDLMSRARTAIAEGRFSQLQSDIGAVWGERAV